MKSFLCAVAIAAFISANALANEPTTAENPAGATATTAEQHPTDAKVAKKAKKAAKKANKKAAETKPTAEEPAKTDDAAPAPADH